MTGSSELSLFLDNYRSLLCSTTESSTTYSIPRAVDEPMPMLGYPLNDPTYPFYTLYRQIPPGSLFNSFLYDTPQPAPWQDSTFDQTTNLFVISANQKTTLTSRPIFTTDAQPWTQFCTQPYDTPLQGSVMEYMANGWDGPVSGCINYSSADICCNNDNNNGHNIPNASFYSYAPNYSLSSSISQVSDKPKDAKKYICPICSHRSQRRHNLLEHIQTHNTNRIKKFSCSHCNRPFARKYDMRRHEKIHTRNKPSSL
ncbi:hypothetical protein CLU79DRAFT_885696 [Phycomyces nitens]|nr:hypothetical protein CLU79DRAFT_885696 [Phycomyces nitens]